MLSSRKLLELRHKLATDELVRRVYQQTGYTLRDRDLNQVQWQIRFEHIANLTVTIEGSGRGMTTEYDPRTNTLRLITE
jgi:hypothetical protein